MFTIVIYIYICFIPHNDIYVLISWWIQRWSKAELCPRAPGPLRPACSRLFNVQGKRLRKELTEAPKTRERSEPRLEGWNLWRMVDVGGVVEFFFFVTKWVHIFGFSGSCQMHFLGHPGCHKQLPQLGMVYIYQRQKWRWLGDDLGMVYKIGFTTLLG